MVGRVTPCAPPACRKWLDSPCMLHAGGAHGVTRPASEGFGYANIVSEAQLYLAIGTHLRSAPFRPPALHVHSDGIAGDMGPGRLDVDGERGSVAAKPLWAYAGLIDSVEEFVL